MFLQKLAEKLSRRNIGVIDEEVFARTQAQINHRLKFFAVSAVTNSFVIEFANFSEKSFRQSRSSARSLERFQRGKIFKRKTFNFIHRFDFRYFAVVNYSRN